MQEEKRTFSNFSERTDALAVACGVDLGGLAKILGIGRTSFFSYRTGKHPISGKAWAKLEAAEKRVFGAAQNPPATAPDPPPIAPLSAPSVLREESPPYGSARRTADADAIDRELTELLAEVQDIRARLRRRFQD